MSVNASICSQCGLLRRDYSFEEQSKPFPKCLACVTGSDRSSRRASSASSYNQKKKKPLQQPSATASTKSSTAPRLPRKTSAPRQPAASASFLNDKLTCTHCGVLQHAIANFTEEERESQSPCCRSCRFSSTSSSRRNSKSSNQVLSKRQQFKQEQAKLASEQRFKQEQQRRQEEYKNEYEEQAQMRSKEAQVEEKKIADEEASPPQKKNEPPKPAISKLKTSYQVTTNPTEQMYMNLVESLLLPERRWGVPEHLRTKSDLYQHVRHVLDIHNDDIKWLVEPLIAGLTERVVIPINHEQDPSIPIIMPNAKINVRIGFGKTSTVFYSLLAWTCQYQYLRRACGWKGTDDIVHMVLATPGIHVNDLFFNKTHAAFLAVLYASPTTLDLLLQSGIDLQQTDAQGQSILYHALEYPQPSMLRQVLNHIALESDVSFPNSARRLLRIGATALQQQQQQKSNSFRQPQKQQFHTPMCWKMLGGIPSLADIAESLIVVRQRGASLIKRAKELDQEENGETLASTLTILKQFQQQPLVLSLTGQWLPPAIEKRVQVRDRDEKQNKKAAAQNETVQLCTLHELDTTKHMTTLACGHLFCHACVVGYNAKNQGRPLCPMCSRRLGREVLDYFSAGTNPGDGNPFRPGTGNIRHDLEHEQLKSLSILSNDQLGLELKALDLYSAFSTWSSMRDKFINYILESHLQPAPELGGGMTAVLNTSATHTHIVMGEHGVTVAPAQGPVCIEASIKGVPILAHLNNTARWTLVSSSVVGLLNLERLPHMTTTTSADGVVCTHLRQVTLDLSSPGHSNPVHVTLHNAVEVPSDFMRGMGIQLGLDFFLSATYCCLDVEVQMERKIVPMRCDGLCSWVATPSTGAEPYTECLRYHARNGQMVRLPVLHWDTSSNSAAAQDWEAILTLSQSHTAHMEECHWCGRVCGTGSMTYCRQCRSVCYCDEHCQTAAQTLHQFTCEVVR